MDHGRTPLGAHELAVFVEGREVDTIGSDTVFGEVALVYDLHRTATIRAKTRCAMWVLHRAMFQHQRPQSLGPMCHRAASHQAYSRTAAERTLCAEKMGQRKNKWRAAVRDDTRNDGEWRKALGGQLL